MYLDFCIILRFMNNQGLINQLNLLNTLVYALEKEKKSLQQENQRLYGQFASLSHDHNRYMTDLTILKQKNQELYNNIMALNSQLRKLEGVQKLLLSKQNQLAFQKSQNTRFEGINAHKQEKINELTVKISSLQNQGQHMAQEFSQKIRELENKRIYELKLINEQKNNKDGEMTTEITRRDAIIKELTIKLTKQIQISQEEKSVYNKQNQELSQRYVQALNTNQRYQKSVLTLENYNSLLKVQLGQEKKISAAYQKEIEANKIIIKKIQNELNQQQKQNKQSIAKLSQNLENERCLVHKQSRQYSQLFTRFQSLEKQKVGGESELTNRLTLQSKLIKSFQTRSSELELHIQGLQSEKEKLQNSIKDLQNEIQQKNVQMDLYEKKITESQNLANQKQLKNIQLNRKIEQFTTNKAQLQIQLKSLQHKMQELKHQNQQQKKQYKENEDLLKLKILALQKQVRKLQNQIYSAKLNTITEGQSKNQKDLQNAALRKIIAQQQKYISEQKVATERLAQLLMFKRQEIESIQSSNSMLRKQLMNALANEDAARKELLVQKSKQISSKRISGVEQRKQISRKNTGELFKKRATVVTKAQDSPEIQISSIRRSELDIKCVSSQTIIQSRVQKVSIASSDSHYQEI